MNYIRKFVEDYRWRNMRRYIFLKSSMMNLKGVGNVQCEKLIKELSKSHNSCFISE